MSEATICGAREPLLSAYLDGELDLTATLDLEAHLAQCAACSRWLDDQRALRQAIVAADLRFNPSADQSRRLRQALAAAPVEVELDRSGLAAAAVTAATLAASTQDGPRQDRPVGRIAPRRERASLGRRGPWDLRAVAALLLVGIAGWLLGRQWPAPTTRNVENAPTGEARNYAGTEDLMAAVVASHVRAQLAGRMEDVESSDRHTVKPWFAGHLDYAPPVVDLAAWGYPLRGGRLEYLDGRAVAVLVYQAGAHQVSVFVWPEQAGDAAAAAGGRPEDAAGAPPRQGTAPPVADRRGFQLMRWTAEGMRWWAVTDASSARLVDFVGRLRSQVPSVR